MLYQDRKVYIQTGSAELILPVLVQLSGILSILLKNID